MNFNFIIRQRYAYRIMPNLQIEAVRFYEMLVDLTTCKTKLCHNYEDENLNSPRSGNVTSNIARVMFKDSVSGSDSLPAFTLPPSACQGYIPRHLVMFSTM
jgi:hypothetical protein